MKRHPLEDPTPRIHEQAWHNPEEAIVAAIDYRRVRDVFVAVATEYPRVRRSLYVVALRFGLITGAEESLVSAGRLLNVTPERIRQLEAKGMRCLRYACEERGLWRVISEEFYAYEEDLNAVHKKQLKKEADKILLQKYGGAPAPPPELTPMQRSFALMEEAQEKR